jgi:hypothetical protein
MTTIYLSIEANIPLSVDEVWPDGDEPDDITPEAVMDVIGHVYPPTSALISEWSLDDDFTVTAQVYND